MNYQNQIAGNNAAKKRKDRTLRTLDVDIKEVYRKLAEDDVNAIDAIALRSQLTALKKKKSNFLVH